MISKAEIKFVRSLAQKKFRDEEGMFIVEGEKMVQEAIASDLEVVSIYRKEDIGEEVMSRITLLSSPSPVLAVVKKPPFCEGTNNIGGVSLALDSVRDPGNMGTILRIADWFGIERVFCSRDCVELYNPKTVQSSMGAIFRKKVIYTELTSLIEEYTKKNVPVYGTFLDGNNIYSENLEKDNCLIVMGSENNGISDPVSKLISNRILIPPYPADTRSSESLNVAIATAIVCSEFRR